MRSLQTQQPSVELRSVVRAFAERDIDGSQAEFWQLTPARLEPVLEFQFQGTYDVLHSDGRLHAAPQLVVVGGYPRFAELTFRRRVQSFAVFFQPTGFSRLFGMGIQELFYRFFDATAVLGKPVEGLRAQLAECKTFQDRVRITEAFLCLKLGRAKRPESMWQIADYIFEQKGVPKVHELADFQGIGVRQFERMFQSQIGTTPKHYARITRFQSALDAKAAFPKRSWLHIAHEFGYHDQMHMIREFHEFAGFAPGLALTGVSHTRPTAQLLSVG